MKSATCWQMQRGTCGPALMKLEFWLPTVLLTAFNLPYIDINSIITDKILAKTGAKASEKETLGHVQSL